MRFVPTSCLRSGMQLGKTLYGKSGGKLLSAGVVLNELYISHINMLGYQGIYIEDDLSKDIEVANVISEDLHTETMNSVKKVFITAESTGKPAISEGEISQQVENIVDELIGNKGMMINMIDLKCFDNYTYLHSVNVAVLSIIIGIAFDMNKDLLIRLGLGALLHDIGKVFVDKDILNKKDRLTQEEFEEMKTHSKRGYSYLVGKFAFPITSNVAVLDHHEKFDGSGYPNCKKGNEISLFGRIITVADVYDALTSERPYRKALSPSESMEYMMGNSGTLFDPDIVNVFIKKIAPYPVGTMVELSNGYQGIIAENYESFCLRPLVRVVSRNNIPIAPFEMNLKSDYKYLNVTISGALDNQYTA